MVPTRKISQIIEDVVLSLAAKNKRVTTPEIIKVLPRRVSRQYINVVIKKLIKDRQVVKGNSTKNAFYFLPKDADSVLTSTRIKKNLQNEDLKEHEVLDEIIHQGTFFSTLKDNLQSIFNYTFSEMLNNAIEHSHSKDIEVEVIKDKANLAFIVNDFGIGVFRSIMQKGRLKSEIEAIQDLLKGKTTTNPKAHSGEGIFFTSKMADVFTLESYEYQLTIDNNIHDIFVGKLDKFHKGTKVIFNISTGSKKHTSGLFKKYQSDPETLAFDKTEIQIKLYTMGTIHVSRSQARRVLEGLEKFKTIILDFDKVPSIGQGFADEIFRVFQSKHPEIQFKPINTNEAVKFMIDRVKKP